MKTAKIVPTPNSFDTNWHPHLLKSLAVWASIVVMLLLIFFLAFKFEKFTFSEYTLPVFQEKSMVPDFKNLEKKSAGVTIVCAYGECNQSSNLN